MVKLPPKISKSILLSICATVLMQLYYLANVSFNLWENYFPGGYIAHVLFYLSIFAATILFLGSLDLGNLGIRFSRSWLRRSMIGLVFASYHLGVRIVVLEGTFGRIYPIQLEIYIPAYIILGLLIGWSEESAFRGYIQANIIESSKPLTAILLSSVLFGIYHIHFIGPPDPAWWTLYVFHAFTGGIFMGLLYYETGNLLSSITYHSAMIIIGQIMPWTPLSSPSHQLTIASIVNLSQIPILKIPGFVSKSLRQNL